MQTSSIVRNHTNDHDLQPPLIPYSVPTSLDLQHHSAISFSTDSASPSDPNHTINVSTVHGSSVSKYYNQLFDPIGEPPDTGMAALHVDVDEDSDDSDYRGTNDGESSESSTDDTSLVSEHDMAATTGALGQLV